jgi:hypothetical protein
LRLVVQENNVPVLCAGSGAAADIFGLLQCLFRLPDYRLVDGTEVRPNWKLDDDALITIARSNSFLFSVRLFKCLFSCKPVPDFASFLAAAFEHFSQYLGRQWQLMYVFFLEIRLRRTVSDSKIIAMLEDEITRLNSLRERLTRTCRIIREEHDRELAVTREQLHQFCSQVAQMERELSMKEGEMEQAVPPK